MQNQQVKPPSTIHDFPVIAGRPTSPDEFAVVADRGCAHVYDRYIVWRVNRKTEDGSWLAFSGFYTNDLHAALLNMEGR